MSDLKLRLGTFLMCFAVVAMSLTSLGCSKASSKDESDKSTTKSSSAAETQKSNTGDSNTKGSNTAKKPCDFVTIDEVNKITGVEFSNVTSVGNPVAASVCTYTAPDGKSLIVAIVRRNGAATIATNKNFAGHTMIENLGDEAIWVPTPGYLAVRNGKDSVQVTITKSLGDDASRLKFAKAIVKIALKRMSS